VSLATRGGPHAQSASALWWLTAVFRDSARPHGHPNL
jgi:hypothetical protein